MTISEALRYRYLTDATFHARVYFTAARSCRSGRHDVAPDSPSAIPCRPCIERAVIACAARPWVGYPEEM